MLDLLGAKAAAWCWAESADIGKRGGAELPVSETRLQKLRACIAWLQVLTGAKGEVKLCRKCPYTPQEAVKVREALIQYAPPSRIHLFTGDVPDVSAIRKAVLSYCLGQGTLGLKGQRQRPWLEIIRTETEKPYQNQQLRNPKDSHPGQLDYHWDVLPTDGSTTRTVSEGCSDELHRAYELMYPRDKKIITPQIISIVGMQGVSALWSDRGRVVGRLGKLVTRWSHEENEYLAEWINSQGLDCRAVRKLGVQFTRETQPSQ